MRIFNDVVKRAKQCLICRTQLSTLPVNRTIAISGITDILKSLYSLAGHVPNMSYYKVISKISI